MRNLKKVIALVAVFAMLVSTVAFAQVFGDVASTDNYAEAIETLNALGIITGDDENNDGVMEFRPADTITRAEVTAIISRIQGMNNAAQVNTEFNDVPSTHWASGYVAQAASQGIVNGYGDGNFGPEDNVKYEEIIKMLMETLGYRPFANDNGGYPTGYMTAAQRYGVLDDVIGGGMGVEAPRGMVAQMVYNAIDTPLMDQITFGENGEYTVYDNRDSYGYKTLLTRDLKMIRATGKVVANSYTDTDNSTTDVDTSANKTMKLKLDNSTANYNYLGDYMYVTDNNNNTVTRAMKFYQGEVDVDPYIGYAVELYAAQESSRNDDYTVVSITPNNAKNNSISFTLDQYEGIDFDAVDKKATLEYLKNETDRNATRLNVQGNPTIIYNGAAAAGTLDDYFGNTAGLDQDSKAAFIIGKDTEYSGQVTLLDTDDASGYDVVVIDLGVSAVVKEVTARGQIRFMTGVDVPGVISGVAGTDTLKYLEVDEDETSIITNITKDGEAIDIAELTEWDVVTVIWNAVDEVYNVKVLGSDKYVDGSITSVGSNGKYRLSDGNSYELAANAYLTTNLEAGVTGRFYIDEYGKLVAHDKSVEVEGAGTGTSGNYAYVLNAVEDTGRWGALTITVQVLDKSGDIYEADFASSVKIVNLNVADKDLFDKFGGKAGSDSVTIKLEDYTSNADAQLVSDLAKELRNNVITYAGNSQGEIKTIVLPGARNDENADLAYITNGEEQGIYYEDTMTFKGAGVTINPDTIIFYAMATGTSDLVYGDDRAADKDLSGVATGAELAEGTYQIVAVDPDINEEAAVVVIMNENGGVSPSANIAVIDSIGTSVVNGTDDVYVVDYYMNGELMTATTDADLVQAAAAPQIEDAKRGDLWKLTVSGDVITNVAPVLSFVRTSNNAYEMDEAEVPEFIMGTEKTDEEYFFGAITRTGNGSAYLTIINEDGSIGSEEVIKEGDANVYVYDPEMRDERQVELGGLGDADVDADLKDAGYKVSGGELNSTIDTPAYGMMDYAFARYYNNRPADIVVYKNYDFGKYTIEEVEK